MERAGARIYLACFVLGDTVDGRQACSILFIYSICDSRGNKFDIIFYHISLSTEVKPIEVYIF